ncbi:MAG: hypothetical protein AMJ92_01320 [candidate division Zixibacteria bacterium SM23_81]|nr:MAG: hypothetical protein AMJ92_01320 [candidate division Zixibacteria bacterium SM23_81]
MLCEDCGKKKATVHFTQIVSNKKTALNLCLDCARNRGFENSLSTGSFSLGNILASFIQESEEAGTKPLPKIKCQGCGLSYQDFREYGRLGCHRCYETFFDNLKDLLRRIHGSNDHAGKVPRSAQEKFIVRKELKKLQREMKRAVEREDFEEAAAFRDKIRKLQHKRTGKTEQEDSL